MIKPYRQTTKRLELLVDILNSDHLFKGDARIARNNSIAVFKNDEELFVFCIDELLDSQVIDLCNIIVTIRDCVEDSFKFILHASESVGSIFFKGARLINDGNLCLQVGRFQDSIDLSYRGLSDERVSIDSSFRFENVEMLSEEIYEFYEFLNKIKELEQI